MGIIERWKKRREQKRLNETLEARFTEDDKEALALINKYALQEYNSHFPIGGGDGFLTKAGGYRFWCPPSKYAHPYDKPFPWLTDGEKEAVRNGTAPKDPEYIKMAAFLTKYPEYKTSAAQLMRGHYEL